MVLARGSAAPSTAARAPGERGPAGASSSARLLEVSYTKSRHDASLDSRFWGEEEEESTVDQSRSGHSLGLK